MNNRFILMIIVAVLSLESMEHVPAVFQDLPKGVQAYLNDLPKIKPVESDVPSEQGEAITEYLLKFGGYSNTQIAGREELQKKIEMCINNQKPITRCIPAFPVSSANPDKIPFDDAHAFSMGDLVALLTQNHVSCEVNKVYKKGSSLHIYWEPWVYELNKVCENKLGYPQYPQGRITSYQKTLADMVSYLDPMIKLGNPNASEMERLYATKYSTLPVSIDPTKKKDYTFFFEHELEGDVWTQRAERTLFESKREALEKQFNKIKGMSFDAVQQSMYKDKVKKQLGTKQYMKDIAADLAEVAISGSQRQSILMKNEIPDYEQKIRATIRPDYKTVKDKVGTPMIYGSEGTPWHKVLAVRDNRIELAAYKDITRFKTSRNEFYTIRDHKLPYVTVLAEYKD